MTLTITLFSVLTCFLVGYEVFWDLYRRYNISTGHAANAIHLMSSKDIHITRLSNARAATEQQAIQIGSYVNNLVEGLNE